MSNIVSCLVMTAFYEYEFHFNFKLYRSSAVAEKLQDAGCLMLRVTEYKYFTKSLKNHSRSIKMKPVNLSPYSMSVSHSVFHRHMTLKSGLKVTQDIESGTMQNCQSIAIPFGTEKLGWCGCPMVKKFKKIDYMFICLGRISAYY